MALEQQPLPACLVARYMPNQCSNIVRHHHSIHHLVASQPALCIARETSYGALARNVPLHSAFSPACKRGMHACMPCMPSVCVSGSPPVATGCLRAGCDWHTRRARTSRRRFLGRGLGQWCAAAPWRGGARGRRFGATFVHRIVWVSVIKLCAVRCPRPCALFCRAYYCTALAAWNEPASRPGQELAKAARVAKWWLRQNLCSPQMVLVVYY